MLKQFELAGVRNLQPAKLVLNSDLNVIHGENASGKTSLLEAIAILASGKSFRTHSLENVINHDAETLRVFGKTAAGDRLGYQWTKGAREIRINGESVSRASALAQALPLQIFAPDTHVEFTRSRHHRTGIVDWVLFHVEQGFHETWSRYRRVLSQRNAALKQNQAPGVWDDDLIRLGETIVDRREAALEWLRPKLKTYSKAIPGGGEIDIRLKKGWAREKSFREALKADRERDQRDGYTHSGAHRTDIEIRLDGHKAKEEASQGQLKTLVMVLRLSQMAYFIEQTNKPCLFLLDDLPAELDLDRRAKVLELLAGMPLQVFVTATEPDLIELGGWSGRCSMFHVEHGNIESQ